jgi:hypothetical protein
MDANCVAPSAVPKFVQSVDHSTDITRVGDEPETAETV